MSKSIFASLENMDLTAPLHHRSSSPPLMETPSVSHKRPVPREFDAENSQPPRRAFASSGSYTPAPLPSISSLNVASAMQHYLSQKSATVSDTEEILSLLM